MVLFRRQWEEWVWRKIHMRRVCAKSRRPVQHHLQAAAVHHKFNSVITGCDRIYLTNNYFRLSCARWGCFGKQRWKICRADRRTVWPFVLTLDQPKGNAGTISILFTTLQPRWRVIITDDGCRLWWWCWWWWFAWVECSNVQRRLVSVPEILSNSISICKFPNFSYVP